MKKGIAFSVFFTLFTVFPAIITFAQDIQEGNATWYETDSLDLHASHARFPPGTRLRVTNLNNQREVYVTVTDRIQNSDNRILDISQEAAALLGMNKRGSTPIRLVVIRGLVPEPMPAAQKTADNPYEEQPVYEDVPVPEITAIAVSPDDEEYEDYEDDYEEVPPVETASVETPSSPPPPIRTFPQQPASQSQSKSTPQPAAATTAAQPAAEAQVLLKKIVVVINGREQTIDIPDGVYIPLPAAGQTPSRPAPYTPAPPPAYTSYPPASAYTPYPPAATSRPAPPPAASGINIIPKLPDPYSGKVYRIQIGAFSRVSLAQVCFDRLKAAGFSPAFEQNGNLYRVVLSGIKAAEVSYAAQRLGAAGFTEAWIREESRH
jgi:rare lipoprotein A (peptidoglycan hydrolase)